MAGCNPTHPVCPFSLVVLSGSIHGWWAKFHKALGVREDGKIDIGITYPPDML